MFLPKKLFGAWHHLVMLKDVRLWKNPKTTTSIVRPFWLRRRPILAVRKSWYSGMHANNSLCNRTWSSQPSEVQRVAWAWLSSLRPPGPRALWVKRGIYQGGLWRRRRLPSLLDWAPTRHHYRINATSTHGPRWGSCTKVGYRALWIVDCLNEVLYINLSLKWARVIIERN